MRFLTRTAAVLGVLLIWSGPLLEAQFIANPLEAVKVERIGSSGAILFEFDEIQEYTTPPFLAKLVAQNVLNDLRLLDVRPRAEYDAGHLPKAVWVDVKQAEELAKRPGGLTDAEAWAEWSKPLGLTPDTLIMVMDGSRQLDAARVWWLLRYLGVQHGGLIDGNFDLWKIQQRPVTQTIPEIAPNPFPVDFQANRVANRVDLLATIKTKNARVVDARSVEEFLGQNLRSRRGGHIPDACRLEWLDFVDKYGRFLPKQRITEKLAAAGLTPGESVVTHCQGGGRASVDAFVFEAMGYPTRNFYLGWSDWGNAEETPITTEETRVVPAAVPGSAEPIRNNGYIAPVPQMMPGDATVVESTPLPQSIQGSVVVQPEAAPEPPAASKPFVVEYYYKCRWGTADEFLELFKRNHLPVLRERMKGGELLKVTMTKPRIHTAESIRWDYRVTIEFRDAAAAFDIAADEPIKVRLFPDQEKYKTEEQRRFAILEAHTDLPIEPVDLDPPVTVP